MLLLNAKKELNSLNLVFEELQGLKNKEIITMENQKVKSKETLDNFLSKFILLFDVLLKHLKQQELFSFNIMRKVKKKYTMAFNEYGNSLKELKGFSSFLVENFMNKFSEASKEEVFEFSLNPFIIAKYAENVEIDYLQLCHAKKKVQSANKVAWKEACKAVQQVENQFSQFSLSDVKQRAVQNFVQNKILEIQEKLSIAFEKKVKAEQSFDFFNANFDFNSQFIEKKKKIIQAKLDLEQAFAERDSLGTKLVSVVKFKEDLDFRFKEIMVGAQSSYEQLFKMIGNKESFLFLFSKYQEALNKEKDEFVPQVVEMFS